MSGRDSAGNRSGNERREITETRRGCFWNPNRPFRIYLWKLQELIQISVGFYFRHYRSASLVIALSIRTIAFILKEELESSDGSSVNEE